jgi:hypothetical protein
VGVLGWDSAFCCADAFTQAGKKFHLNHGGFVS